MEVLNTDPRQLSPLNLAFIGDCVYEMRAATWWRWPIGR